MHQRGGAMVQTLWKAISFGAIGLTLCGGVFGCGAGSSPAATSGTTANQAAATASGPVSRRGEERIEVTIGPAGGTLELANGMRLVIPEGALPQEVDIAFSATTGSRIFRHREDQESVGPAVMLTPAFRTAVPMTLSVPFQRMPAGYSSEDLAIGVEVLDNQRALSMGGVQTRWQLQLARMRDGRLEGEVTESHGLRYQFVAAR